MEDRGQNEAQHPISIVRKVIVVRGPAVEGDEPGIVETIEVLDSTPEGVQETAVTRYSYCGGCNRAIKDADQVGSLCVGCGAVLCLSCSNSICANEQCQKAVCPSCRQIWGGLVYCKQHAREEVIKRVAAFFGLVVFVTLAMFIFVKSVL